MKNKIKGQIVQWAAILGLDVGAPLIATCTQFPVWVERSAGSTVSGLFVVFALICTIPVQERRRNTQDTVCHTSFWHPSGTARSV